MENYYQILEVSEDASVEDIKKSYRKLAKEWHPDVNDSPDAENKFKKITEAYNVLSDAQEKNKYDRMRRGGSSSNFGFNSDFGPDISQMFDNMFGGFGSNMFRQARRVNDNIIEQMTINPQETLKPIKKKKNFTRKVYCEDCSGSGGHDFESCKACNGQGIQMSQHTRGGMSFVTQSACQMCGGNGKKPKKTCNKCSGRGYVSKNESIELDILPMHYGNTLELQGYGHLIYPDAQPGSLLIQVVLSEHKGFKPISLNGDVECSIEVDPVMSIVGGEIEFENLEESKCKIKIPAGATEGKKIKISNQGMMSPSGKRGNLIANIKYTIPKNLSSIQKDLLNQYLDLNKEK